MIDLRTLLVLMAVADLVLAAALWVGGSRRHRDGLSHWAASLVVRAMAFGLFAWQAVPAASAVALGGGLLALSLTLQAASLLAFDRKPLAPWIHAAVVAAVAVPLQLLGPDPGMAVLFGGVVLGTLMLAAAAIGWQLQPSGSHARAILVGSFVVAGVAFTLRGVGSTLVAEPLRGLQAASGLSAATLLAAFAAAIAGTLAYLMLHKERADAEALRLGTMDPLTGAYNRRTFHEIAEREMSRARRAGQPLSIVMLDIDHFRGINEAHGHRAGDEVLARFADMLRAALRKEDMLVRYGGEEFLVMLPGVPGPGAVIVAGRLRRAVANNPLHAAGQRLHLTASFGVAARMDEGPESIDQLLAQADAALALAKQRGRNRVVALSLGRSIAA